MALQNSQLAEFLVAEGLRKWPQDSTLLDMAGRIAAVRGDYAKAELYWKQAIAALPAQSKTASLFGGKAKGMNALFADQGDAAKSVALAGSHGRRA